MSVAEFPATGATALAAGSIDTGILTEPEMGARTGPCTLLIVEDEGRTRTRLAAVIAAQPQHLLLDAVATLAEARAVLAQSVPQVLLLDLGLPDDSGIELIVETRRLAAPPEVLVISVMGDESSVLNAIQAGAGGYLLKDLDDLAIVAAARSAAEPAGAGQLGVADLAGWIAPQRHLGGWSRMHDLI